MFIFDERNSNNRMPQNKNALVRYKILDELLSNPSRRYTRKDLYNIVLQRLKSIDDEATLTKRTIEKDLYDLQDRPFEMEIIEEGGYGEKFVRYADQSQSLFSKPLSDDEKVLLREVLNTLGQFDGLDSFDWLQALQERLNDPDSLLGFPQGYPSEHGKIISFSKNPYLNNLSEEGPRPIANALSSLFSAISSQTTVTVYYKKFNEDEIKTFVVFPYLLKQYNDRWYLICALFNADPNFIMNLPLDRMLRVEMVPQIPFQPCAVDLEDRFSRIVGVTYRYDREEIPIVFAVSTDKAPYIKTKPIHETQREFIETEQKEWKQRYPMLDNYRFFEIECIPNNELMSLFFSFDKDIIVISPKEIRDEITEELDKQFSTYKRVFLNDV